MLKPRSPNDWELPPRSSGRHLVGRSPLLRGCDALRGVWIELVAGTGFEPVTFRL